MAYPTITDLPSAPQRTQTPDAFSTTADAFVAALPNLVTEVNAAGAYIDTKTVSVGNAFQGTYSAGTTYTTGQSVLYSDLFYLSLVDSNTGNTPDSSPSQWVEIAGSAAGGGGGTVDFTASGSLTNGDLVKLNLDGTVSVIEGGGPGTAAVFETAAVNTTSSTFDSNSNKVVIAYRDQGNSNYGTAVVGTVSGTSISFGTPVVFRSANTGTLSTTFDSNSNKVVIAFSQFNLSNYGAAIVGTVSGTSISFGSETVFESATTSNISATFDSNSNKVVIAYEDRGNSDYGTAVVGTVSGTSISFGSPAVFESAACNYISSTFDSNSNKVVIAYRDEGNSNYGTAVVGTVSGTSISFGSPAVFTSSIATTTSSTFDSNSNKVVIAYADGSNSSYGTAVVGTVSGTSISFGTPVVFEEGNVSSYVSAIFNSNTNEVVIVYKNSSNSNYGMGVGGEVSGTSISFGDSSVFESANSSYISATFDSNSNIPVIAYSDGGNSDYGTAVTFEPSDVAGWIGFASADATDGSTATINVISSVNEGQTGLTIGSKYYLPDSGTLTTTVTSGREVGRAVAADKILITQGSIS